MYQKLVLSFLGVFVFFQGSCSNSFVKVHHANTVYGLEVLGVPQSFTKGQIVSARDVQIEWEDSEKEPGRVLDVVSIATEFVIKPEVGQPFLFVQFNEEQLKAGERILLLKNSDKTRIVRDRAIN